MRKVLVSHPGTLTNSCAYEALLKMLYDRTFGGAYSIFQGYHFMKFGIGAVVADIHNCKEEDFALSRADAKTRGLQRDHFLVFAHSGRDK